LLRPASTISQRSVAFTLPDCLDVDTPCFAQSLLMFLRGHRETLGVNTA
jgi:hypothetical protein